MPNLPASQTKALLLALLVITLNACGGGSGDNPPILITGGGGSGTGTGSKGSSTPVISGISCVNSSTDNQVPSLVLTADCAGNYCGTENPTTYSGSGVGAWSFFNSNASATTASVKLNNVTGKSVTLLWTNLGNSTSPTAPSSSFISGRGSNSSLQIERLAAAQAAFQQNLSSSLKQASFNTLLSTPAIAPAYTLGNSKTWYDDTNMKTVSTTLRSQGSLSNGYKVNIWVQDSEWNTAGGSYKITQAMADLLRDKFSTAQSGIFDMVTSLTGGQPWGSHSYGSSLIPATQDIQIVLSNLTPDLQPSGLLGYFYGNNNFLKNTGASNSNSNEALMFFLDSETLASPVNASRYQADMVSSLAHEFVHMINFYQRAVLPATDRRFDSWLEETSAMMVQNIIDKKLSSDHYSLTESWFPDWISKDAASNCSLTDAYSSNSACFSYNLGGTYGGYLLRQYGLGFYKDLLQSTDTNSISALTNTIKKYDTNADFGTSVRRWGASIALLDSSKLPTGFGYPERSGTVGNITYTLPAVNGPDFASSRYLAPLPTSLKSYAHAAQSCTASGSSYYKRVNIPASTALTVIVN